MKVIFMEKEPMKIDSDSCLGSKLFVGQAVYSVKTCPLGKTISNRRVFNSDTNTFIFNILRTTHLGINRTLLIMHYKLCIKKGSTQWHEQPPSRRRTS